MTSKIIKSTIRFLTLRQVKQLHLAYISFMAPCRDHLLGSAIEAPMNIKHYEGEQDIIKLAAILASRIIKNHAFNDGNKRTSLLAANMFLKLNGKMLCDEPFDVMDPAVKTILEEATSSIALNRATEVELANEYGRVVKESDITVQMQVMRDQAIEY
ncbi:MAG: hypothetical protein Q9166_006448 [cf. Caloplaca sp. 2 TL-2023]